LGQVAGYVIASIIGASIIFLRLLKPANKLIPSQRGSDGNGFIQHLRILISYGMPLYISILLWGFLPLYQSVVLSFFTTDADIGNLKAAANFLTLLTVLSTPITTVLLPAFAKLDSSATDTIKVFFKLANNYASLVMIPATVLVIVFSREIVHIIYGSTFQPASLFLSINSLLYFLVGIGHLTLTSLFNGLGETRITLKVTIINFLIFIILAPILTMIYSVPGAIIASLISNTAGTSYAAYIGMIKFKIGFEKYTLLKIYLIAIISSIPPLLLFHLTSPQELFKISIGGLLYIFVYVTLIPLAKIVSRPELQKVSYVIKKIKTLNLIARPILKYMERISNYGAKT
jgi:O-antigen/teichoic acid export membrane protein